MVKRSSILFILIFCCFSIFSFASSDSTSVYDEMELLDKAKKRENTEYYEKVSSLVLDSIKNGTFGNFENFKNVLKDNKHNFVYSLYSSSSPDSKIVVLILPISKPVHISSVETVQVIEGKAIDTYITNVKAYGYRVFVDLSKKQVYLDNNFDGYNYKYNGHYYYNASNLFNEIYNLAFGIKSDSEKTNEYLKSMDENLFESVNVLNNLKEENKKLQEKIEEQGNISSEERQQIIQEQQNNTKEIEKLNNFLKEGVNEESGNYNLPNFNNVSSDNVIDPKEIINLLEKFKSKFENTIDFTDPEINNFVWDYMSDEEKGVISLPVLNSTLKLDPVPICIFINSQTWLRNIIILIWNSLLFIYIYKDVMKYVNDFKTGEVLNKTPRGDITEAML